MSRGMAGGMNSGVTYLGMVAGARVAPGTAARALPARSADGTRTAEPVTIPALTICRRVSMTSSQSMANDDRQSVESLGVPWVDVSSVDSRIGAPDAA